MRILRNVLLVAAMAWAGSLHPISPGAAQSEASPEAVQAANELVSLTSGSVISELARSLTLQAWPAIASTLRRQNPRLTDSTETELRNQFYQLEYGYLSDFMRDAPAIYARYFTAEELRAIAAFYRTPAGMKTMTVMPAVTAEMVAQLTPDLPVMQQKVSQTFNNVLRQRGYIPPR